MICLIGTYILCKTSVQMLNQFCYLLVSSSAAVIYYYEAPLWSINQSPVTIWSDLKSLLYQCLPSNYPVTWSFSIKLIVLGGTYFTVKLFVTPSCVDINKINTKLLSIEASSFHSQVPCHSQKSRISSRNNVNCAASECALFSCVLWNVRDCW